MCKHIHTNVLSLKADEAFEFLMDSMHFYGFEFPEYFKNLQLHKKTKDLCLGDIVIGTVSKKKYREYIINMDGAKALIPFKESIKYEFKEGDKVIV